MTSRLVVLAVVLMLAATGAPYVRRRAPRRPREVAVVEVIGSRDRHLHGKARIRARRAA